MFAIVMFLLVLGVVLAVVSCFLRKTQQQKLDDIQLKVASLRTQVKTLEGMIEDLIRNTLIPEQKLTPQQRIVQQLKAALDVPLDQWVYSKNPCTLSCYHPDHKRVSLKNRRNYWAFFYLDGNEVTPIVHALPKAEREELNNSVIEMFNKKREDIRMARLAAVADDQDPDAAERAINSAPALPEHSLPSYINVPLGITIENPTFYHGSTHHSVILEPVKVALEKALTKAATPLAVETPLLDQQQAKADRQTRIDVPQLSDADFLYKKVHDLLLTRLFLIDTVVPNRINAETGILSVHLASPSESYTYVNVYLDGQNVTEKLYKSARAKLDGLKTFVNWVNLILECGKPHQTLSTKFFLSINQLNNRIVANVAGPAYKAPDVNKLPTIDSSTLDQQTIYRLLNDRLWSSRFNLNPTEPRRLNEIKGQLSFVLSLDENLSIFIKNIDISSQVFGEHRKTLAKMVKLLLLCATENENEHVKLVQRIDKWEAVVSPPEPQSGPPTQNAFFHIVNNALDFGVFVPQQTKPWLMNQKDGVVQLETTGGCEKIWINNINVLPLMSETGRKTLIKAIGQLSFKYRNNPDQAVTLNPDIKLPKPKPTDPVVSECIIANNVPPVVNPAVIPLPEGQRSADDCVTVNVNKSTLFHLLYYSLQHGIFQAGPTGANQWDGVLRLSTGGIEIEGVNLMAKLTASHKDSLKKLIDPLIAKAVMEAYSNGLVRHAGPGQNNRVDVVPRATLKPVPVEEVDKKPKVSTHVELKETLTNPVTSFENIIHCLKNNRWAHTGCHKMASLTNPIEFYAPPTCLLGDMQITVDGVKVEYLMPQHATIKDLARQILGKCEKMKNWTDWTGSVCLADTKDANEKP